MIYKDAYHEGYRMLEEAGVPDAKLDARYLLEAVCHTNQTTLFTEGDRILSLKEEEEYLLKIKKRRERIPLQQIIGTTEFMGLTFKVTDKVLCPRQDTEVLVEEALRYLNDNSRILDMCTGSGCILLSLLHYSNHCCGVGVDISEEALQVARENAVMLKEKADFRQGDLFENIVDEFEMIISNPPYIRTADIETLMPEVKDYEPRGALDGYEDGLYFYRKIISCAREHLCGGGILIMEIGFDQAEQVKQIMQEYRYTEIRVVKDFAGQDRVILGMR